MWSGCTIRTGLAAILAALACNGHVLAQSAGVELQAVQFDALAGGPQLTAYWTPAPVGVQAAPAVVALHGCSGLPADKQQLGYARNRYTRMLHDQGYGVLWVDSMTPRGVDEVCSKRAFERSVDVPLRADDARAALRWLAGRGDVAADKLAVVGWSHGGQTVLAVADARADAVAGVPKPAALVAFYPGCNGAARSLSAPLAAPLLVMSGTLDDWTPAYVCRYMTARLADQGAAIAYIEYPDSYHAFDAIRPPRVRDHVAGTRSGTATVGGNPAAREASGHALRGFLQAQLGLPVQSGTLQKAEHPAHAASTSKDD